MNDSPHQITRREVLKRGAIVGGTVLWVAPMVQTLGMGRAFAQVPSQVCTPTWADQVMEPGGYLPGDTRDGGAVPSDRNNPDEALGTPDNIFVSLGFGGVLIVRLHDRYYHGNSGSALVVETTTGAPGYPLEKAEILVSENSMGPWFKVGNATNQEPGDPERTTIPLDAATPPPPNFRWVKLVDISNKNDFVGSQYRDADGFDVDAVGISCP